MSTEIVLLFADVPIQRIQHLEESKGLQFPKYTIRLIVYEKAFLQRAWQSMRIRSTLRRQRACERDWETLTVLFIEAIKWIRPGHNCRTRSTMQKERRVRANRWNFGHRWTKKKLKKQRDVLIIILRLILQRHVS